MNIKKLWHKLLKACADHDAEKEHKLERKIIQKELEAKDD